jgi:replication factor C subunit 3/5
MLQSKPKYIDFNFDLYDDFKIKDEEIKPIDIKYLPWVEKFRPQYLDEIISNKEIVQTLKDYVKKKYLPHLLICGPSGTGKTSVIISTAKELYGNYFSIMTMHINASEERGIEVIRNKVKEFVSTKSFNPIDIPFKLIILDEADAMTISAQGMLRRMIEDFTGTARFCLLCNKLKNIDPAIQSRCTNFRFAPLTSDDILKRIEKICKDMKIKYKDDGLKLIIKVSNGDMRKVLNNLQSIYMAYRDITYENVSKCIGYPTHNEIDEIYKILLNKKYSIALKEIKDIIVHNQYFLLDILNEIHLKLRKDLLNNNISIERFSKIIMKLKNVEQNSFISVSEPLQISEFVGSFY